MQGRRRSRAAGSGTEPRRWGATSSSAATTRLLPPSPWIWRPAAPPRHAATTTPSAAAGRPRPLLRRRRRLGRSASSRSTCSVGSPCWYVQQTTRIYPPPSPACSLPPSCFFFLNKPPSCFLIQWLAIRLSLNSLLLPNRNQIELLAEWGSLLAADRLSAAMVLMPTTHVHG